MSSIYSHRHHIRKIWGIINIAKEMINKNISCQNPTGAKIQWAIRYIQTGINATMIAPKDFIIFTKNSFKYFTSLNLFSILLKKYHRYVFLSMARDKKSGCAWKTQPSGTKFISIKNCFFSFYCPLCLRDNILFLSLQL